jgi:MFS family permease
MGEIGLVKLVNDLTLDVSRQAGGGDSSPVHPIRTHQLGDARGYGKARMLSIGRLLFGGASIACALAPSAPWLIAARLAQGIAAALLTPASLALIGATYPKDERNQAIGVWAAASALTTAAGPVVGGWLTETFGWQAVFWINPPLGLVAVGLLWAFAPRINSSHAGSTSSVPPLLRPRSGRWLGR